VPIVDVKSGADERDVAPAAAGHNDSCAIIANYAYGPNLNGVRWFLKNVWPTVKRQRPAAILTLVGGGADRELRALATAASGVTATGHIGDLQEVYQNAGIMLVPLFQGGGTRLKIVEAWKMGKAVLTTTKGIEGIPVRPGVAAICDEPAAFSRALVELLSNPDARLTLARTGQDHMLSELSFERIAERLGRHSLLGRLATVPGLPAAARG
jgi:glycosyltransferase involved in cell wall biosynthesis